MTARKVPERFPLSVHDQNALVGQLQNVLQQDGYTINKLIDAFEVGAFTPTFTFATPGDLSVSYAQQQGAFWRVGSLVFIRLRLQCAPTFSSSSGAPLLQGLPYASAAAGGVHILPVQLGGAGITYPTSRTAPFAYVDQGESQIRLAADGSGAGTVALSVSNFSTGVSTGDVRVGGFYITDNFEHP